MTNQRVKPGGPKAGQPSGPEAPPCRLGSLQGHLLYKALDAPAPTLRWDPPSAAPSQTQEVRGWGWAVRVPSWGEVVTGEGHSRPGGTQGAPVALAHSTVLGRGKGGVQREGREREAWGVEEAWGAKGRQGCRGKVGVQREAWGVEGSLGCRGKVGVQREAWGAEGRRGGEGRWGA